MRYYLLAAHYRSVIEYSEEALAETAVAVERIAGFVTRAAELVGPGEPGEVPAEFAAAMDDDLAVPAALAILNGSVTRGNGQLATGGPELAATLAEVRGMLDVLGVDPLSPVWVARGGASGADAALDSLIGDLLDQRATARADKDFAAADRVRDQLTAAGIEIEDTPHGPRWTVKGQ